MARYRGRFAPSPTGPLHFGSLIAAVASYVDARASSGEWLVRMEDVDEPRECPGAADGILRTLERFGLEWDGPVLRQSTRKDAYRAALERLDAYGCACSRREVCTCRTGLPEGRSTRAWRVHVPPGEVCFDDRVQGRYCERDMEDFVVFRADGYFAYQLAVVVDDAGQGITDVVRGADLLDSTPRQIVLQRQLGLATPRYLHVPVATNTEGQKLSKQTYAPALDHSRVSELIRDSLRFLGQRAESLEEAIQTWNPELVLPIKSRLL